MPNCLGWTRVSTKHQEDNGGSLDYQKGVCEQYALSHNMTIKGWYGGKHESAKTPGKMIKEMVQAVKKDKSIKYILVSEFDRFSRNAVQALGIINDLRGAGKVIIAAKNGTDTSTKDGYLMATIALGLAEWDNSNRVDKFLSGRKDCLLKGVWAEKAPRGYTKEGKSKGSMCKLNDEGKLIRKAFLWKLENTPNQEILARLEARGMKLSPQALHKILTNVFYAGKIKHKLIGNQMVDGVHEQAVTYTQFLKVQDILAGRTGVYTHKKQNEEAPLLHFLKCADDNTPMTAYNRVKPSGKCYTCYKCQEKGCCNNISAKKLHSLFYDLLKEYHIPECMMPLVEKMVIDILSSQNVEAKANLASLRKKLTEIDKDMKDCHLRHATGKIADETFSVAIQALEERKSEILLGIENCENNLSNSKNPIDQLMLTCSNIASLWSDSDLETQRKVQFLIFPDGILWDKQMKQYRTLKCNDFFEITNRISSTYKNKTEGENPSSVNLCGRRESNPYASRHQILSLACLPISTRPRQMDCKDMNIFDTTKKYFFASHYFWNLMQHQLSIES